MIKKDYIDIKKTLKISIQEGVFAQIYMGLAGAGSVFITKLAVMLGANSMQFGILAAIGQFSQIFQPLGVYLTRNKTERKGITVLYAALGRFLAFSFGLLPFLFSHQISMWIFLILFTISISLQAISSNTWIAWISDLIPTRFRGRFFSVRNQYLLGAGIITGYVFAFIVDLFDKKPGKLATIVRNLLGNPLFLSPQNQSYLYLIVFSIAGIIGLSGLIILKKQPERPKDTIEKSFGEMLVEPLKDKNFRRLIFFGFWWMFAIGIGAPFWQPFMIKNLGMSVFSITIYATISTIFSLLALKPWGQIIDHFGNKNAMRIGIIMGGFNPLLWAFVSKDGYWPIFIEAAGSGIMWSGVSIVMINFVLSISGKEKRQMYSGLNGAVSGIGMMLTMLLSGAFLPDKTLFLKVNLEPEQVLFLLSGFARWSALIPLMWVNEKRAKPMGEMIVSISRYAKVRLARLAWSKSIGNKNG